ncbi:alpha/beta hydrolase [Streptomyces somaliensis]|uniref:alpha/beta fold hydrolase n=1 Tax=Streptomyces somaliensis TaxID=78355 RepID=UPI0020CFB7A8|nr:alpha/beta fold hydrolase [Streptomyces somaliensis]MCP9946763.1 alpha/beta hydrolase [Streptomyces somaliensis]MCP9963660.1 alpha/beta hydrolase [Streptomyces somaliensis]MCP9972873.1 alpha/beta hydrolase [Streptomyces somaliensis]
MTEFVLVGEVFTGGWIWDGVAELLRGAGAGVHAATLPADPGTDLDAHVRHVVELVDGAAEPEVVLVGHGYGIHPVLGAADLRPARVARIVHLDAGMPRDGDPALGLVPDEAVRERLLRPDAGEEPVEPPATPAAWNRWGSTEGVPADALERLTRLAVPQPPRTLTAPLRLTGAAEGVPTTGVLCSANGPGIDTVQGLADLGDPRLRALAARRVTFFELATGHWPMLSAPRELAAALLDAAAGGGRRLAPAGTEPAPHLRPFLLEVPERRRERHGRVDLYLPDGAGPERPLPAVLFVHGGPVPAGARPTPRDWPAFTGYGGYVAGRGAVGATLDHRLHDLADYPRAAEDVTEAVALIRADPRVDADRIALWFFSAGGLLSAPWLASPPPWLRCVAATYPVLVPMPGWGMTGASFRPADAVRTAGRLPLVVTRVERERPDVAATVGRFLAAAAASGAAVEVVEVPGAHHGFETVDRTDAARGAVERAAGAVLGHLRST